MIKEGEDTRVVLGISICGNKDQFCRATGRTKAFGRMKAKCGHRGHHEVSVVGYDRDAYTDNELMKDVIDITMARLNNVEDLKVLFVLNNIKVEEEEEATV